jgi:hypothetical protein
MSDRSFNAADRDGDLTGWRIFAEPQLEHQQHLMSPVFIVNGH